MQCHGETLYAIPNNSSQAGTGKTPSAHIQLIIKLFSIVVINVTVATLRCTSRKTGHDGKTRLARQAAFLTTSFNFTAVSIVVLCRFCACMEACRQNSSPWSR